MQYRSAIHLRIKHDHCQPVGFITFPPSYWC